MVETPNRAASFANRDHAPSCFWLQHSATPYAAAAADLCEILPEGNHDGNISRLRCKCNAYQHMCEAHWSAQRQTRSTE